MTSPGAVTSLPPGAASLLVIGGGIAGITAAVEAAECGTEVILLEREPSLGGRVAQLHQYFPKLCPPYCGLEINFQRLRRNPRIHVYTLAEVERLTGGPGDFTVTVRQRPRFVNERCTGCQLCVPVCPAERPDAFNFGMGTTKAVYLPHALAFPPRYVIDEAACRGADCGACVAACPYEAIDLAMPPRTFTVHVGAVVVATGWAPYDARRIDNLGFGRYADVITNVMMERLAAPQGPTQGRIVRPSDGRPAKTVVFVQCAGQRDETHLGYCSGICCLASLKQATYVRSQYPDAQVYIFYIDLRAPAPYTEFAGRVRADPGVRLVKGKIGRVDAVAGGRLRVAAEDIFSAEKMQVDADLVVLATGMEASLAAGAGEWPVALDADHFVLPAESAPGIFAAGCARGPVDVATAAQDATAAAMHAMAVLRTAPREAARGRAGEAG